ncbi:MAG TPA: M20/M25/M40 family metallo-hydrolase [Thermoleophilia bacterium]|nr:M20/M25/M40 family metallo-hydrolase [Thermoleophilia bacterium]
MHGKRFVLALALAAVAVALLLPAAAAALTYDQAVDQLYARGYPQNVETYLNSLGTSPLGFRLGGTAADDMAARYLADKLRGAGYRDVKLEPVPVDEWAVRGASVTVDGHVFTCSQFAGVPGTDAGGITAEVVYVGNGMAADYEGVDVRGKIVLVDSAMESTWLNFQGAEATLHGALAAIITSNFSDGTSMAFPSYPWYSVAPDALGANDGEYDMSFVPLVYMSQQDGDWLKSRIEAGSTEATFVSKVDVVMARDGGKGFNVIATLPGKKKNGEMVIWNAHHDAHFRAGLDDTGAVVATLAAAKAMKMCGYRPNRTIKFVFDTAEEFGYTDCWYDWSTGAWHFITKRHPDWAGRIAAMYSIELMAAAEAQVDFNTSPELVPWLEKVCSQNPALTPYGYEIETPQSTWQNGWSFMACGVPSFEISAGGPDYGEMYHSTYENQDVVDWEMTANMTKLFMRLHRFTDARQLPYDFVGRADDLRDHFDPDELAEAGLTGRSVKALDAAITRFRAASRTFGASAAAITGPKRGPASRNPVMLRVAKKVVKGMTALDAWDYTAYPHEQAMWDNEYLAAALAALDEDPVDTDAAIDALTNVGINVNGVLFSPSVHRYDLTRHDPDYYRVTWGKLGKLGNYFDTTPVMAKVEAGRYDQAQTQIRAMLRANIHDLDNRVATMAKVLNEASAMMRKAR